jgi:hypothetical protein
MSNCCNEQSNDCVRCPGEYLSCELDRLLIPKCIQNMTYDEQCNYVLSNCFNCFRPKILELYRAMTDASYNIKRGSCANPFYIKWDSINGSFFINGKSLAKYYDHCLGTCYGFGGLLQKILEQTERNNYVNQLRKEGKYCSRGRC